MTDIVVPTLGESVSEATVAKWMKQAGGTPCPILGQRPVLGLRRLECGDADRTAGSLRKVGLPFKSVLRTGAKGTS